MSFVKQLPLKREQKLSNMSSIGPNHSAAEQYRKHSTISHGYLVITCVVLCMHVYYDKAIHRNKSDCSLTHPLYKVEPFCMN